MWVFLKDAMLSIVADDKDDSMLLVRGRLRGDIERVFPGAVVTETRLADYRFRARLFRDEVGLAMTNEAHSITYPNFKASVKDRARHDAYMRVWVTMSGLQDAEMESEGIVSDWKLPHFEVGDSGPTRALFPPPARKGKKGKKARARA